MNRYIPPQNAEEKILQRRVQDLVKSTHATRKACFLGFLSPREQQLALAMLNKLDVSSYVLDGGYQNAERKMLCVFGNLPPGSFTFTRLLVCVSETEKPLAHRDYLGALLAMGIKRECVGDIIVAGYCANIFIYRTMVNFLVDNLSSVGRSNIIDIKICPTEELKENSGEVTSANIASTRLDVILSVMLNQNRKNSSALIASGAVKVNHIYTTSVSLNIHDGDVFSIKGFGRYKLSKICGKSRKNRLFIEYLKY